MNQPPGTTTQPQPALPRSSPPRAGAPEVSTWSTRSEASMNDVDTDKHRQTITDEEGHTQPTPTAATTTPAPITCIMPMSEVTVSSLCRCAAGCPARSAVQ